MSDLIKSIFGTGILPNFFPNHNHPTKFLKYSKDSLCHLLGFDKYGVHPYDPQKVSEEHFIRGWQITFIKANGANRMQFQTVLADTSNPDVYLLLDPPSLPTQDVLHCTLDSNTIIEDGIGPFNKQIFFKKKTKNDFFFLSYGEFIETTKYTEWYFFSHMILDFGHGIFDTEHSDGIHDAIKIECATHTDDTIAPVVKAAGSSQEQPLFLIAVPCPPVWIPETGSGTGLKKIGSSQNNKIHYTSGAPIPPES